MDLGHGLGHLTYSTLVHPGDDWEQMWASLTTYVPKVKARFAPGKRFGVSLRLSAHSAQLLVSNPYQRGELKTFLADNDMYLYTVNAFPYGAFKGQLVKEKVYEPDWRTDARTEYTINVAEVLADVAPPDISPSIQSVPLGFKPRGTGPEVAASYAAHVLKVVAHLVGLEARTGRTVTLALEPEPCCFLETTDEAIAFFKDYLHTGEAAETVATLARIPISEAIVALRRHVGTVYDICHQAVEYENISDSLQKLVDAGVPVFKLQEAAALHMPEVTKDIVDQLRRYSDSIYLTQTVEKKDGKLTRFLNLEDAFAAFEADPGPREWRTHFHVPVFLEELGPFRTTRFAIEDALQLPQGQALVAPARDRDLHLGRVAR